MNEELKMKDLKFEENEHGKKVFKDITISFSMIDCRLIRNYRQDSSDFKEGINCWTRVS